MVVARGLVNFKLVIGVNGKTFMLSYDLLKISEILLISYSKLIEFIRMFLLILRNLMLSSLKSLVNVKVI
jgi:hypothetical protein